MFKLSNNEADQVLRDLIGALQGTSEQIHSLLNGRHHVPDAARKLQIITYQKKNFERLAGKDPRTLVRQFELHESDLRELIAEPQIFRGRSRRHLEALQRVFHNMDELFGHLKATQTSLF
jgi:hypothetical protein